MRRLSALTSQLPAESAVMRSVGTGSWTTGLELQAQTLERIDVLARGMRIKDTGDGPLRVRHPDRPDPASPSRGLRGLARALRSKGGGERG